MAGLFMNDKLKIPNAEEAARGPISDNIPALS
jgi:hypothetical protein